MARKRSRQRPGRGAHPATTEAPEPTRHRRIPAPPVLLGVAIVLVALVTMTIGSMRQSGEPEVEPHDVTRAPQHVGRAVCGECHPSELAAWSGSDHDLAMQVADEATVLGDFAGKTFEHFGSVTTFSRRDGKYVVRTDGPDGQPHDYEVAYTFGVRPLQQYLLALPGGRLQALSVAWDSRPRADGGQRWFHLYPDEAIPPGDLLHWTGFAQSWNDRCAECHSTNLKKGWIESEDRYETTWSEVDVSCEACHGPGSRHVAWAREPVASRPTTPRAGLDVDLGGHGARWVMDPARGIAHREPPRASRDEIETCARCHARRGVVSTRYEHGHPLLDTHRPALLEEDLYFADGQIKDEVYEYGSFLQSRMYAAGVTCSDCHDPHSLELRSGSADATCAQCHLSERFATSSHHHHGEGSPGSSCVACHMPERTYMVVDPRRDHSLRIPRPALAAEIGAPDPCTACHTDRTQSWAALAIDRWGGQRQDPRESFGRILAAAQRGAPGAARDLARIALDRAQPDIARATAVSLLWDVATPDDLASLQRGLTDADPMVRAATVAGVLALPPRERFAWAAPLLADPVRLVRIEAARVLAPVPRAGIPASDAPALDAALTELRSSLQANADQPEGQMNLGILALEEGDLAGAERGYRAALRLAPSLPQPYVNLADVHRLRGRDDEAERLLRQGLSRAPESADLHHALGLTLVRQQKREEAIAALRRAAELAPDRTRYVYVLAVALGDTGKRDEAIAVLREANRRRAGDRDVLLALTTMSRDAGDRAAALAWARELSALSPADPDVRSLVSELELGP